MLCKVRVDLDHAQPPIWHRLDVRSDVTLDVMHQVLQVAFGWSDSHLHRFSLGGDPFDLTSQVFLCPCDVEEGDLDDKGGVAAVDVRLNEVLQEPGDGLAYVYDYGDAWEVAIRLEEVLPAEASTPYAVAVEGRRAAPPEDSGGAVDAVSLALELDDPEEFDLDEINEALRDPFALLTASRVVAPLVDLVGRLRHTAGGDDLAARALMLAESGSRPDAEDVASALGAVMWFLDRASGGGIELTASGYLKPADVEAASAVVPVVAGWIGKKNRESHTLPLLDFRETLRDLGLLRKYKGRLLLTRLGASVRGNPEKAWDVLAERLVPAEGFNRDATLLVLLHAATSAGKRLPLDAIAASLGELGWRLKDGQAIPGHVLYRLPVLDVLDNVGPVGADLTTSRPISPAAAALARAALQAS